MKINFNNTLEEMQKLVGKKVYHVYKEMNIGVMVCVETISSLSVEDYSVEAYLGSGAGEVALEELIEYEDKEGLLKKLQELEELE